MHELLSRVEQTFDPAFTLLGQDIKLDKFKCGGETIEILKIKLKSPKEDRIGKDCIVDVYSTNNKFCPVKYFEKWQETCPPFSNSKPAFRQKELQSGDVRQMC